MLFLQIGFEIGRDIAEDLPVSLPRFHKLRSLRAFEWVILWPDPAECLVRCGVPGVLPPRETGADVGAESLHAHPHITPHPLLTPGLRGGLPTHRHRLKYIYTRYGF